MNNTLSRYRVVMNSLALFICVLTGHSAMATPEPEYQTVVTDGDFEIRDYPAMIAAEVHVPGDRDEAGNAAFRLLADYIFGGNTRREKICWDSTVAEQTGRLRTFVANRQLRPVGAAILSRYNPPWTLWFLRRNEVWLQVKPDTE